MIQVKAYLFLIIVAFLSALLDIMKVVIKYVVAAVIQTVKFAQQVVIAKNVFWLTNI